MTKARKILFVVFLLLALATFVVSIVAFIVGDYLNAGILIMLSSVNSLQCFMQYVLGKE